MTWASIPNGDVSRAHWNFSPGQNRKGIASSPLRLPFRHSSATASLYRVMARTASRPKQVSCAGEPLFQRVLGELSDDLLPAPPARLPPAVLAISHSPSFLPELPHAFSISRPSRPPLP